MPIPRRLARPTTYGFLAPFFTPSFARFVTPLTLLLILAFGCAEQSPPSDPAPGGPTEGVLEYDGPKTPAALDRVSAHLLSNQLLGVLSLLRNPHPAPFEHPDVVPRTPSLPWEDLPPGTASLLGEAGTPAASATAIASPAGDSPELRIPFGGTSPDSGIGPVPLTGVAAEIRLEGSGRCSQPEPDQSATYEARIGGNTGIGLLTQDFVQCSDDDSFTHHGRLETRIHASASDPEGGPADRIATWVEHHYDGFEYDYRQNFNTRLALKGTISHRNDPSLQELHTRIDSLVIWNRIDGDMTMLLEDVEERIRLLDGVEYRSLSGRFYSDEHGWLEFALAPALRWGGGPTQEPTLALFVSGGSADRLIITHESGRGPGIELDLGGDGSIEGARLASRHTRVDDDWEGPGPQAQADRSSFNHLEVATTVRLSSSPSSHGRGGLFTQSWEVVTAPEGGMPIFTNPGGFSTELTLIERGEYELALRVHDGEVESAPFLIELSVGPEAPFWNRVTLDLPPNIVAGEPWVGHVVVQLAGDPFIEYEVTSGPAGLVVEADGTLRWDDPVSEGRFFEAFESLVSLRVYNGYETIFRNFSLQVHTGAAEPFIRSGLNPPISDSAIQIADLAGDGQPDILVSDGRYRFYALSPDGDGGWMQSWMLPNELGIRSFHAIDADGDGAHEVYLHYNRGVMKLDGATRERTTPVLFSTGRAHGIRVADVDADGQLEIVTLHGNFEVPFESTLAVHDLATGDEEWSLTGLGLGERMRVGQLDADAALEIVLDGYGVVDGAGPLTPGGPIPAQWNPGIGLGNPFDVGDVDDDDIDEIVTATRGEQELRVFDAVGLTTQLQEGIGHDILDLTVADVDASGADEVIIASGSPQAAVVLDASGSSVSELWTVSHGATTADRIAVGNLDGDPELELVWAAEGTTTGSQIAVASSGGLEWATPETLQHDGYFVGGERATLPVLGDQILFASAYGLDGDGDSLHLVRVSPETGHVAGSTALRTSDWTLNGTGHGVSPGSFLQAGKTELAFLADGGALEGPPLERTGFYDFESEAELSPFPSNEGQRHPRVANADADALDELFLIRGTGIAMIDPNDDRSAWEPVNTTEEIIDFEVGDLDDDGNPDLLVVTETSLLHYEWVADALVYHATWTDAEPLLHLELGDATGDGEEELVLTNGALAWILSPALVEIAKYPLPYPNHGALVVDSDAPGGPGILLARGEVIEVDALTGDLRWISPDLIGDTTPEGLHLHSDGEGGSFISIATSKAVYVTR